jgi:hypothetical protein
MRFRSCLWSLLAAAHLLVVVCGACDCLPDAPDRRCSTPCPPGIPAASSAPAHRSGSWAPLAHVPRSYARLSGADSQFGFYAPAVGSRYRARFILHDDCEATWCDSFEETNCPEARLRLGGIVESGFANGAPEQMPELRQRLVKSWAAAMFSRHPSAVALTAVVEVYDLPTMAEYRGGLRPHWAVVYQAQVQRDSPAVPERTAS